MGEETVHPVKMAAMVAIKGIEASHGKLTEQQSWPRRSAVRGRFGYRQLGLLLERANIVIMRRSCHGAMTEISDLQAAILEALPERYGQPIPAGSIFVLLGVERPTVAQRSALSKSLSRLEARRLILRRNSEGYLSGKGYLWSRA
jgi:hypothetical protein